MTQKLLPFAIAVAFIVMVSAWAVISYQHKHRCFTVYDPNENAATCLE